MSAFDLKSEEYFANAGKRGRQCDVDLIKPHEMSLRSCILGGQQVRSHKYLNGNRWIS